MLFLITILTPDTGNGLVTTCNFKSAVSEFNEFKPCLKFLKNRFQLSARFNLEKLNTILSETNHICAAAQIL